MGDAYSQERESDGDGNTRVQDTALARRLYSTAGPEGWPGMIVGVWPRTLG
jgi:hypothetical protein